jgi:hypothetical protein
VNGPLEELVAGGPFLGVFPYRDNLLEDCDLVNPAEEYRISYNNEVEAFLLFLVIKPFQFY